MSALGVRASGRYRVSSVVQCTRCGFREVAYSNDREATAAFGRGRRHAAKMGHSVRIHSTFEHMLHPAIERE